MQAKNIKESVYKNERLLFAQGVYKNAVTSNTLWI